MVDRFDLEEKIMSAWRVTDDIQILIDNFDSSTDDDALNILEDTNNDDPYQNIEQIVFKKALGECISTLPEREALVLSLYYDEELNLREIGQVIDVSESRVSQIHSQAMHRLKARMQAWTN